MMKTQVKKTKNLVEVLKDQSKLKIRIDENRTSKNKKSN